MSGIWYWPILIFWRIIFFVSHFVLYLCYLGKRKSVPPINNPLLLKSAKKLSEEIRTGKLKCEEVIQSYRARIKEVNPYINAIVQDRLQDALEEAKQVDALVQSGKFTIQQLENEKPLLGVPFTVKLLLKVKGFRNTGGSKVYEDVIATEDSPCVTLMKNAGAILLATTNAPEFGLSFETNNLVHGKTCNPYDTRKTPGGSSGGESALIGAGASVIGLGNDIAGSLRIPAHCTGIFSHKPTVGTVPNSGNYIATPENQSPLLYTGPMCRYSEDMSLMMKILTSGREESLNFDHKVNFKNLKIFYSLSIKDPKFHPVDKEIIDGIRAAVCHFTKTYDAFAKEIKLPLLDQSSSMYIHRLLDTVPNVMEFVTSGKVVDINLFAELFSCLIGRSTVSIMPIIMSFIHSKTSIFYNKKNSPHYQQLIQNLSKEFDDLLDENSVFLFPTFPTTAPYHYEMIPLCFGAGYDGIFNVLGLPVTNCPIGLNQNGMPKGMQIIGRKNNDLLTLACANEISKVFEGWIPQRVR